MKSVLPDEVYGADEAFTGTAAEVTPIRELDRRAIGEGSRFITQKTASLVFRCCAWTCQKNAKIG